MNNRLFIEIYYVFGSYLISISYIYKISMIIGEVRRDVCFLYSYHNKVHEKFIFEKYDVIFFKSSQLNLIKFR